MRETEPGRVKGNSVLSPEMLSGKSDHLILSLHRRPAFEACVFAVHYFGFMNVFKQFDISLREGYYTLIGF